MENTLEKIDMNALPDEARNMLMDFYYFLVEKYSRKSKAVEKTNDEEIVVEDLLPKKVPDFVPMKREEIYAG
ncbi:MAG: hypothetical protein KAW12_03795 [Candidatus Aminicenantes bacterium]|nr:hypothetical protein [Candidatus Aminicenantes bacterium]